MDLSILVVSYRSLEPLRGSLPTFAAACAGLSFEIIVVDNASADGTADALRREFPGVRVIDHPKNVGFAGGVNRGIREAQGRFLALLNPDAHPAPGALTTLVRFVEQHPDVGLVGPKILDPDGGLQLSCRRWPTHWTALFNRYSLLSRLFPKNPWTRDYLMLDFDHASVRDVDWVAGACMVTSREAVARVGPMDEEFFLFNEDVDWCHRMHDAGLRVVYVPDAVAEHAVGASRGLQPAWLIWRRHLGMRHYARKHHRSAWPIRILTELGIFARAAIQIAANPFRALLARRPGDRVS
jgi:GT2 family glycosyltransferase